MIYIDSVIIDVKFDVVRTAITIDDTLFKEAEEAIGESNPSVLVTKALKAFIAAEARKRILLLSGSAPDFKIPARSLRSESHPLSMIAEEEAIYKNTKTSK